MGLFDGGGDFQFSDLFNNLFGGGGDESVLNPSDYSLSAPDYTPSPTSGFNVGDLGSAIANANASGYGGGADILGGSYYGASPARLDTPQAPTSAPVGGGDTSYAGRLAGLFGGDPNTQKMVAQLLPLLAGGGIAAGTSLFGANAGNAAARGINRDTQRIVAPTAQEQAVLDLGLSNLQQAQQANKSPADIYGELGTTLGPMIEELLSKENEKRRMLTEQLIGNRMATSGVFPQQTAYLAGDTNRAVAEMIAKMVAGERSLRSGAATQAQNVVGTQIGNQQARRQQGLLQGQGQALQAAQTAGTAPANAATQAALIAAILGQQQPNYRGTTTYA